jgi:MFS family permease
MAAGTAAAGPVVVRRLGTPRIALLTTYWLALGFLWLPLGSQVLPIMIKRLVGDAHKGTGVAILEGIGTFIAVFWQPVMGAVSDRTNSRFGRRKPFIVIGTVGSMVFLLLMILTPSSAPAASGAAVFFAPGYIYLLVLYFLLQVSENAAQAPYQGLLPDVVPEEERSRASGFVGAGNLLGLAIGFYVAGTFMGSNRPDLALIAMAAVLGASMLAVVLSFPDKVKPDPGLNTTWREVIIGTFAISPRQYSDFLWLMVSRLTILVAIAGLQRYAVFYFKDVFYPGSGTRLDELASIAARDLQVIIVLFALVVSLPAAELSHRTGRKPIILGAALVGALGTVGLIASASHILPDFMISPLSALFSPHGELPANLIQALYFGILVGVAAGAFLAVDWAFMMDVIPHHEAGRFLGFSNIATAGSGVIAGFVGGFLIDYFNGRGPIFGQPGGYPATFIVYIVSFVVGGVAIFKVKETRGRRRGAPPAVLGH